MPYGDWCRRATSMYRGISTGGVTSPGTITEHNLMPECIERYSGDNVLCNQTGPVQCPASQVDMKYRSYEAEMASRTYGTMGANMMKHAGQTMKARSQMTCYRGQTGRRGGWRR